MKRSLDPAWKNTPSLNTPLSIGLHTPVLRVCRKTHKGLDSYLTQANIILWFGSGFATQLSPGGDQTEPKGRYHAKEPHYIMRLLVDYKQR
jgi:hypothetical protein